MKQKLIPAICQRLGGDVSPKGVQLLLVALPAWLLLSIFTRLFDRWLLLGTGLVWNVFLAFLPLCFALPLVRRHRLQKRGPLGILWWVLWLLFFPNVPYLFTDLIHISRYPFPLGYDADPSQAAWAGLCHLLWGICLGCVFGYLSLYLLHGLVRRRAGGAWGWLFCAGACLLCGVGIYIGRFMRFNSWDLLNRPWKLAGQLLQRLSPDSLFFCLLFAGLTFCGYGVFYLFFNEPEAP